MQNSENDVTFKIEKFGISRTAWRFFILALFALLAIAGLFLSLTKGSLDIKVEQIIAILQKARTDAPALHAAPITTPISRPDEVTAARKAKLRYVFDAQ